MIFLCLNLHHLHQLTQYFFFWKTLKSELLPAALPGGARSIKLDFNIVKSETLTGSTFNNPLQIPATDATVLIPIEDVST